MSLSPKEIEKRVSEIAKPIVEGLGLVLFDVKYKMQSGRWVLTVVIDKLDDYVSTKDCELVSYEIEKELDSSDLIPGRYYLEVSSPGLDRPLRSIEDFKRFEGSLAKVKTNKTLKGYIKVVDLENGTIVLEVEGKEVTINYNDIKSANLEVDVF
ncbi:ribosome maturation factor RimP [Fervidobacterium sp.]